MRDADAPPARVLLIQTQRLGDVVLSTALLEELRIALPAAELDWLTGEAAAPLLDENPIIRRRHVLRPAGVRDAARAVSSVRYDWVIDVQGSWRTALVTARSGALVRAGWAGLSRGWGYTLRLPRATGSPVVYVVRDRARLLEALGVRTTGAEPRLYLSDDERSAGAAVIGQLAGGLKCAGMLVSTSHPRKDWQAERFAMVARALKGQGVAAVVFRAPGGDAQERRFKQAASDSAVFAPAASLRGLMGMISACDVFVSGDTGPAHIATALGVPRVTVHGPTPPEGWTPDSPIVAAVRGDNAGCRACRGANGDQHTCLESITPELVLGRVSGFLSVASPRHDSGKQHAATQGTRGTQ